VAEYYTSWYQMLTQVCVAPTVLSMFVEFLKLLLTHLSGIPSECPWANIDIFIYYFHKAKVHPSTENLFVWILDVFLRSLVSS
jgi:hypothetical protein